MIKDILRKIYISPLKLKAYIKLKIFRKNAEIGKNFSTTASANCFREKGAKIKIGDNCEICGVLSAKENAEIRIGNYTTIRGDSLIGCMNNVTVGNFVIISNNVKIYDNNNHPTDSHQRIEMCKSGFNSELWQWKYSESASIIIEDNVWIGEKSTILKGVTIGRGAVVACNTVVTKDVPPYSIVAGNPARIVKKMRNN